MTTTSTTTLTDRLVKEAFSLVTERARNTSEQDRFAATYLDQSQAQAFLAMCQEVRQGRYADQQDRLARVVAIVTA